MAALGSGGRLHERAIVVVWQTADMLLQLCALVESGVPPFWLLLWTEIQAAHAAAMHAVWHMESQTAVNRVYLLIEPCHPCLPPASAGTWLHCCSRTARREWIPPTCSHLPQRSADWEWSCCPAHPKLLLSSKFGWQGEGGCSAACSADGMWREGAREMCVLGLERRLAEAGLAGSQPLFIDDNTNRIQACQVPLYMLLTWERRHSFN